MDWLIELNIWQEPGGFMSISWLDRVRRNHALEHATINVMSKKHKDFSAQGNSTPWGFNLNLYGDVTDANVADAVNEAYSRLQAGEEKLALHPGCGTVLLTTAVVATLAAQTTLSIERRRQKSPVLDLAVLTAALPITIMAVFVALLVSRPLGMTIQANYTVDPHLGELRVKEIEPVPPSLITKIFQLLLGQVKNQHVKSYRVVTTG